MEIEAKRKEKQDLPAQGISGMVDPATRQRMRTSHVESEGAQAPVMSDDATAVSRRGRGLDQAQREVTRHVSTGTTAEGTTD